ncbi:hypothetical protein [Sorangium sp. So ce1335]|uniref:hypothetical protein n=1 Tax=Sorangium sp. So ce1335 TaxID=3133335 RepID=UPI003F5E2D82
MKHSVKELLDVVYRYYPRGIDLIEQADIDRYNESEEYARLVAARRSAAKDERWHALLQRMYDRFSSMVMNGSLYLPSGSLDACYSFSISLPDVADSRTLWFHIGFLVPYYWVYSWRLAQVVRRPERFMVDFGGVHFHITGSPRDPKFLLNPCDDRLNNATFTEACVNFDLSADEAPYAEWVVRDIETTFGCERMPTEVGLVLVPDVAVNLRTLGNARLCDCLFTDSSEWMRPSPCEVGTPGVKIDASSLTEPFIAVLAVLAALCHIACAPSILDRERQGGFFVATVDGVLRKEDLLETLASARPQIESLKTPRGIAAGRELEAARRELEALAASWDGEGEPPASMVAWSLSFLANRLKSGSP